MAENLYRQLPAVNDVLAVETIQNLLSSHPQEPIVASIREELATLREWIRAGKDLNGLADIEAVAVRVAQRFLQSTAPKLVPVINATGIVLHTNLGRAPIPDEAGEAAMRAATGYLNLELDLETGKRSSRQVAVREWICRLVGAESATVVNNNAAATVIVLRTIAQGKEVILSRGQLVEIGGSFRIPEIMAVSGAILREVGTTNITRLSDYERAINPWTGALLQIHTSNYRISGFTKAVPLADLVRLGKQHQIPVIDDIGSGAMVDFTPFGFQGEPLAKTSIAEGADLVLFSGDKLLGGPQAGIIAGKKEWIQKIEKDPLMRAFRLDKMTLAALEATLRIYLNPERAMREIPVLRMLGTPLKHLRQRAETLAKELQGIETLQSVVVREDVAYVGGGSLPDQKMKSWVIEMNAKKLSEDNLAMRLRRGSPAVMTRISEGKVILDVRTILPDQERELIEAIVKASRER